MKLCDCVVQERDRRSDRELHESFYEYELVEIDWMFASNVVFNIIFKVKFLFFLDLRILLHERVTS